MSSDKRVAVIIVVWNNYSDTRECLISLGNINYQKYEIVVVDNGSTDGSGAKIKENFPNVIVIRNEENLGYTGGCNTGIEFACREIDVDYCLILNNDTVIADDNFINTLVTSAETQEAIGIVAPIVYDFYSPHIIQSAGVHVNLFMGRARLITRLGELPIRVDAVHGCAFLVKRKVINVIGGLDDRFYLYWEETDYCLRVQKAGYRLLIIPEASIFHKSGKTIGGRGSLYTYYFFRNRLLLMKLHAHSRHWYILIPLLPIYALIHLVKSMREGNGFIQTGKIIIEAWQDFRSGNFGRRNTR